jgi:tetratricopeptide (TPR) repeat protein
MAMTAYMQTRDTIRAGLIADKMKLYVKRRPDLVRLLSYYTLVQDTVSIKQLIDRGLEIWSSKDAEARYYIVAARLANVYGHSTLSKAYCNKAIALYGNNSSEYLGRCYLLDNQLEKAKVALENEFNKDSTNASVVSYLGIVYAKLGEKLKADEMYTLLSKLKEPYDYGETAYYQARIKAHLGETAAALQLVQNALWEGIKFRPATTFQEDPDMNILQPNPDYQALLVQNRIPR